MPLHEWREIHTQDYELEKGYFTRIEKQALTTWLFEEGTFVPAAKLTENRKLSIVSNYMGTPEAMYDDEGKKSWSCELNSYGKVRNFEGEYKTDCPFRYQGQYEDAEMGLYYNRFRYYSPDEGMYLSQDPIGLQGGFIFYSYVKNTNAWVDIFGLSKCPPNGNSKKSTKAQHGYEVYDKNGKVVKTGVSGGKVRQDGKSYRAEKQVRALNRNSNDPNGPYSSKIVKNVPAGAGARETILDWEVQNANKNRTILDPNIHKKP